MSVKVAYWATATHRRARAGIVFVPDPNVESALVEITRRIAPTTDPATLFALVRTGFGQRRKMLRRSLAGIVDAGARSRRPASRPPRGPRSSTSYDVVPPGRRPSRRLRGAARHGTDEHRTLRAHAKLTLSLRVTGVRDDGYHLIDAEMVSLELHDLSSTDRSIDANRADGRSVRSPMGVADRRHEPRRPGAATRRADRPPSRHRQAHPARRRARRRIDRRGGRAAVGGLRHRAGRISNVPPGSAPTSPFCLVGGRGQGAGIGEIVEPLAARRPARSRCHPAARRQHARGLPGVGRSRRADRPTAPQRSRARGARRRTATGDAGAIASPNASAARPTLAGSGATWFVEGDHHDALADLDRHSGVDRAGRPHTVDAVTRRPGPGA